MFRRKKYSESKIENCPFCGKRSLTENSQNIPVCIEHKNTELLDLKCICGEWLDLKQGKFGPYFNCISCGNMNFNKALELNLGNIEVKKNKIGETSKPVEKIKFEPTETVISSDELDLL